jgi:dihydrofolate synthase/folylpolyglutamate synthase
LAQILFPVFDQVIFAPIQSARAAALGDLTASARITGTVAVAAGSVAEALRLANDRADGRAIVISGSVYLVGEARSLLLAESSAHR